ncbi:hypothetical protein EDD17DRAFT_1874526, partial [Pisolithus thermaeus]
MGYGGYEGLFDALCWFVTRQSIGIWWQCSAGGRTYAVEVKPNHSENQIQIKGGYEESVAVSMYTFGACFAYGCPSCVAAAMLCWRAFCSTRWNDWCFLV